jgi:hypothetical protein
MLQHRECVDHNVMARLALDMSNKTNTATVMFKFWIVKTYFAGP